MLGQLDASANCEVEVREVREVGKKRCTAQGGCCGIRVPSRKSFKHIDSFCDVRE